MLCIALVEEFRVIHSSITVSAEGNLFHCCNESSPSSTPDDLYRVPSSSRS